MARAARARFSCEACGKSYRIRPALAGRRVRCSCGQQMRVPGSKVEEPPPLLEVLAEGDGDEAAPPSLRNSAPKRRNPTAAAPGFSVSTGPLAYGIRLLFAVVGILIAAYGVHEIQEMRVGTATGGFLVAALAISVALFWRPKPAPG